MCSRLRRCKTVGQMPMQKHMWAKIRDNNSISHAWILAPCLAPIRQDVHVLCLDFCAVAATHQDIRPKFLMLLSVIQLLHALSFACKIYTRQRVSVHKITPALHIVGIIFLVLNCVGQQRCIIVLGNKAPMELHIPGLHAKHFWGANFSQTGTQNTR